MLDEIKLLLGGDVMLGRLVKDAIRARGVEYPLQSIAPILQHADLVIVNLECAITASIERWHGQEKAFYFGAPIEGALALKKAGIDLVSLANNHALDYDYKGLQDTLHYLTEQGIAHAGAGKDLNQALTPALLSCKGLKIGMVAFCDHQEDFAATERSPGIAYLNLLHKENALIQFQKSLDNMIAEGVDWPILSLHWGPNMVEHPSKHFIEIAHAAIDMGYRIIFGHSAHIFQRIEIYKGYPIIYAAGDLVDDYYVDPILRNDYALLFEITITQNKLHKIDLHPLLIKDCQVSPAPKEISTIILRRMERLSHEN